MTTPLLGDGVMLDRTATLILAALILFAFSGVRASEAPYRHNVSDIELESAVKGCTYNKGPTSYINNSSKQSECCCTAPSASTTVVTTTTTSASTASTAVAAPSQAGPRIKYI